MVRNLVLGILHLRSLLDIRVEMSNTQLEIWGFCLIKNFLQTVVNISIKSVSQSKYKSFEADKTDIIVRLRHQIRGTFPKCFTQGTLHSICSFELQLLSYSLSETLCTRGFR